LEEHEIDHGPIPKSTATPMVPTHTAFTDETM
jgi:hypothetical protein